MEEKLFMQRRKKGLNVSGRKKGGMKQENPGLWNRAKMCSLADLAGRFVLSVYVRVACDLAKENKKHYRQAKGKQPSQIPSDLCPVNHFAF